MTPSPPLDLKARLLEATQAAPVPTRRTVGLWRIASAGLAAVLLASGFIALGGVHWLGRPREWVVGTTTGFAAIAMVATWMVLRRRKSMLPAPAWTVWALAVAVPVLLLGWSVVWNVLYPDTFIPCKGRVGFVCLDLSLTLGAVPLLLLAFGVRRSEPLRPVQRGLGLGAAVGAWTAVILQLSCECTDPSHVAIGHVGPGVILTVVGAYLGWRLLKAPAAVATRRASGS